MKLYQPLFLALLTLAVSCPVLASESQSDSGKMNIELVIATCEEQYTAEMYPDAEERSKLIDQCIEDNSAGQSE
jgi:hypothetical protein